jgi:hypothetical protein
MPANILYDTLIEKCDCIAWIPTIRGSLSLDLLDKRFLLGDIDKYLVEFKHQKGFESSRYILASSLFTFSDSKYYNNIYCRAFRFFFRGTINCATESTGLCKKLKIESDIIEDKELLIGKLSIVLNLSKNLSETETRTLSCLNHIQGLKDKYQSDYIDKAVSLESLAQQREELKKIYDDTVVQIKQIEDTTIDNPGYRVWKFDVILSRDGILFLKDDTHLTYKKDYFKEDSPSDYTKNIPIHRCFKTVMTYIKYLFHNHYHHDKNNDSFLPVTNLHSARHSAEKYSRIINHQLEPFLQQITKHKRFSKSLSCNPIGISSYAKAFVDIFYYNGFIETEQRDKIHNFIQYQETEAKEFLKDKEKAKDYFITQNNILAAITVGFSFLLATIAIYNFFIDKNAIGFSVPVKITLLAITFIIGYVLQQGYVKRLIISNFSPYTNRKKKKLRFLFKNSNLKRNRLSNLYIFYLYITELKLKISKLKSTIFNIILMVTLIFLIAFFYFKLLKSISIP